MKPILFNTEMVKAIMDGRKNVTRRAMKPQPVHEGGFWKVYGAGWSDNINSVTPVYGHSLYCNAPYKPDDILYVREAWARWSDWIDVDPEVGIMDGYIYKADWMGEEHPRWRSPICMPKEAARTFLRVLDVRVERLRDITGGQLPHEGFDTLRPIWQAFGEFARLWDSTIKPDELPLYGWNANPWVWVITFERCGKEDETV